MTALRNEWDGLSQDRRFSGKPPRKLVNIENKVDQRWLVCKPYRDTDVLPILAEMVRSAWNGMIADKRKSYTALVSLRGRANAFTNQNFFDKSTNSHIFKVTSNPYIHHREKPGLVLALVDIGIKTVSWRDATTAVLLGR